MPHPSHPAHAGRDKGVELRLVAWETTRNCNLSCRHCRASATMGPYAGELNTEHSLQLLDQIAQVGKPIIILTGGEPLLRPDIFDIADHGTRLGLRMVMAPNGTLITEETARRMAESGIARISISIDGATKEDHDAFRGVEGAFEGALRGARLAKEAGIDFQINTTVTQVNMDQVPRILELAESIGAVAHHIFLLVPTGRGKDMAHQAISAADYESTLNWFYDRQKTTALQLKATCAPQYYRVLRQRAKQDNVSISFQTHGLDAVTRGCLGGISFCFISHVGVVQPCGFLELNCGDVTKDTFPDIWKNSKIFNDLRDFGKLKGKCGRCEFKRVCGGCRARAFEATGDYLEEEPLCAYNPSDKTSLCHAGQ
ncbi:MAG: heme b synthase [Thermodesulfobacteriota bacterium]